MAEDGVDKELDLVLDELDTLLKNPDVGALLTARGINTSLALLVADALHAYLHGKKKEAAEDLARPPRKLPRVSALAPGVTASRLLAPRQENAC